jgi:hypothetical protein
LGEIDQGRQTLSTGDGLAGEATLGLTTSFSGMFAGPIVAATSEPRPVPRRMLQLRQARRRRARI